MQEAMDQATKLLSKAVTTDDPSSSYRHGVAASFTHSASIPATRSNKPSRSFTLYEQRRTVDPPEPKKRPSKKISSLPDRGKSVLDKKERDKGGSSLSLEIWEREKQVCLCVGHDYM